MQAINVSVPDEAAEKLRAIAARERRAPRAQAAVLPLDALQRLDLDDPSGALTRPAARPSRR
jgi:hypothetical protein